MCVTNEFASASSALELARRLLNSYGPEVELLVGGLPPSLASDLPLPAEARLLGSALRFWESRRATLEAVFDTSGEPFAVLSAYERQLQELGWNAVVPFDRGVPGGFLSRRGSEGITLRRGGQGPVLRASAVAGSGQSVDLRAILDWEMPRHMDEMARHMDELQRPRQPGREPMPSLYPPPGVTAHNQGGGGSRDRQHIEASAYTDLAASVLEVHFAAQLSEAGWTRVDGRAEDAVAWSSWLLPTEGEWRGLLLVLAIFGTTRRSLWLQIEAAEA